MSGRHRWTALAIGIPGVLVCFAALVLFVGRVLNNDLATFAKIPSRDYYLAMLTSGAPMLPACASCSHSDNNGVALKIV